VTVADTLGQFVNGAAVQVTSTGASASTNTSGQAVVKVPVGGEEVVTVTKTGFAEQVRVITLSASATRATLSTLLVAREPAQPIAAIENGGSANGKHGVKVTFPAGALVNANGQAASGAIDMLMTPLDTSISDVGAFPGLFEGTAPGTARAPIVSLGTSELVPQQNGQKLQLANGKSATIELPIYATTLFDGTPVKVGDSVPLWSLNTSTGVWQQEGQGTVIAQPASPSGFALRATVTHFSWWNTDQFATRATANVTINAVGTTVPANTPATLEAQLVSGTGPTSVASTNAIVGSTQAVTVPAPSTMKFSARFDVGNQSCAGSATATMTAGGTTSVTIQAGCVQVPTPTIVRPANQALTNSSAPTRVQVVLDGNIVPDNVELFANGTLVKTFGRQFPLYVHQLDTVALPEGSVTLQARATLNGISRDSSTVELLIDRTRPTATQIDPPAGALIGRGNPLTVTFDETIDPISVTSGVVLSVTPSGQNTPTAVPADIRFDATGTVLTVTPHADLPLGTVGLSWGGVKDLAGNPAGNPVAATWSVDQSVLVGPELAHVQFPGPDNLGAALAIRADGSLLAAHRPTATSTTGILTLSRYDATSDNWVIVVATANERPAHHALALAVDGQDIPYVAFTQQTAADPDTYELVLKRLNGTTVELAAPAVTLSGQRALDISQGSMAIDATNRPVVTLIDANGGNVRLFRLEQGTLVSLTNVTTLAGDPHVVLQADGTPLVTFLQGFGGSNAAAVRVVRVVNGVVQQLGTDLDSVPNATQGISHPRIVMSGTEPWAFWVKNGLVKAARFDGTNWIAQPFAADVVGGFGFDAAVLGSDPIIVAGDEARLKVLRFHNGAWEPGFDATARADHQDAINLVTRGTSAAMISSSIFRKAADVQRLVFQ